MNVAFLEAMPLLLYRVWPVWSAGGDCGGGLCSQCLDSTGIVLHTKHIDDTLETFNVSVLPT
jgi:hypothetical protein